MPKRRLLLVDFMRPAFVEISLILSVAFLVAAVILFGVPGDEPGIRLTVYALVYGVGAPLAGLLASYFWQSRERTAIRAIGPMAGVVVPFIVVGLWGTLILTFAFGYTERIWAGILVGLALALAAIAEQRT